MSARAYQWSGILMVIIGASIALILWMQGGQVMDVGQAVTYNRAEIEEVKAIVQRGREERYIAQDLYLRQIKENQAQIDELKKEIEGVTAGHVARLESSQKLLEEVKKLQKKLDKCTEKK